MVVMSSSARPVIFGEVLFDRFPDGSEVLGGAPFNVAWNLRGLGLDPLLVSRVGMDAFGDRILEAMKAFGMETRGIQRDSAHSTGTVVITLEEGEPQFEIRADQAYDHISLAELPGFSNGQVGVFYHGSLVMREACSSEAARVLLERLRDVDQELKVFFDVNLRSPWWQHDELRGMMQGVDHLKLNGDELARLVPGESDLGARALQLLDECGAETLCLTLGSRGARAFARGGRESTVRPAETIEVVDAVGAGDAFSSVLILGFLEGWKPSLGLERAQEFAEAVLGLRGATTTDASFYDRFRHRWSTP